MTKHIKTGIVPKSDDEKGKPNGALNKNFWGDRAVNTMLLVDLLESTRDGQVFNIAKKHLRSKLDCYHDPIGDFCFFTPKKGQKVLPLLLVAHIDTVNHYGSKVKVFEDNGVLRNINGVLGADDRAGIYIILELIKKLDAVPYVLLTNHEEIGGVGARAFCDSKELDAYLPDINMFIEFDRRGINQYVTYSPIPTKMENFFEDYGYEKHHGSYSDAATLSNHYQIGHVNLSAGYFNEHSSHEYCSLAGIQFAIDNALTVLPLITAKVMVEQKTYKEFSDVNWQYAFKSKKTKKGKKSQETIDTLNKAKDYSDFDRWYDEAYGSIKPDTQEISGDTPRCPYCQGEELDEIDYRYYFCQGCKSYFDHLEMTSEHLTVGMA